MSERYRVHPTHPQARLIEKAAEQLRNGSLGLCPTDAGYSLVWSLEGRDAEERVLQLRALDSQHPFTLLCSSLSEAGRLARLDDRAFRLFRSLTPGPCTFILPAASELPRRLKQTKRRAIGIRIPDHPVAQALIAAVREPLLSTTLALPEDDDLANHEAESVAERMMRRVDFMLDAEDCEPGPTSVIDCTGDEPEVIRHGHQPLAI
jgi:tRNA threonylcarbamoyl adenosine modification protein (Sua5/YciO/YrdC/YwlC family)